MPKKKLRNDMLTCSWVKVIKDLNFTYPDADSAKTLRYFFKTAIYKRGNLLDELDRMGFDLTTLKFEIKKKRE
jgi:hypothetical protein